MRAEKAAPADKVTATAVALAARRDLASTWTRMMTALLECVSTPGEMGTVANLELHTRRSGGYLENFDTRLETLLGHRLPAECALPKTYAGRPRLFLPTIRGMVERNEALLLKIIALDAEPVKSVTVSVRPLGGGEWKKVEATHLARAVWMAHLPAASKDFEYLAEAQTASGETLRWPAAAPELPQTVIVE